MYSVKKISCFYQLIQIRSNILIVSVTNKCKHIYKTHKILRYKKIIIMLFKLDGEWGMLHCAAPNVTCFFNFCILIILKHDR